MGISRVVELSVFVGLAITLPALAQEKKIKRADLPPAVEKTVAAQSQGAKRLIEGSGELTDLNNFLRHIERAGKATSGPFKLKLEIAGLGKPV